MNGLMLAFLLPFLDAPFKLTPPFLKRFLKLGGWHLLNLCLLKKNHQHFNNVQSRFLCCLNPTGDKINEQGATNLAIFPPASTNLLPPPCPLGLNCANACALEHTWGV